MNSDRHHVWAAFLFGVLAMGFVVSKSSLLPSVDTYYHLKMARLLPQLGATHQFPWLHWTIFRDNFVSHHFGFQALLAPLVWLSERLTGDLVAGGKTAVILAMGLTAALFYLLLRERGVRHPLAWTCLLGCLPWQFWLRLAYVRAPILALPLLLLMLWLFLKDRPIWVAMAACAFVNIYFGIVVALLIPAALGVGRIAVSTCDRRFVRLVAVFMVGLVAGLAVNPYFPDNLTFLKVQVFGTGLGATSEMANEWQPFDAWFLMKMAAPLSVIWLTALIWHLRRGGRMDGTSVGLLLLNVALMVLTLKARRFIEYWPLFALLNAADLAREADMPADDAAPTAARRRLFINGAAVALAIILSLPGLVYARSRVVPPHDFTAIRDAMRYLAGHSPAGALVFTDDWDVFPVCFYFNDRSRYVVGLDPMFTIDHYPEIWERYRLITRGQTPARLERKPQPSGGPREVTLGDIGQVFGAQYVLVLHDHPRFYANLRKDPERFALIYPPSFDSERSGQPPAALFSVQAAQETRADTTGRSR